MVFKDLKNVLPEAIIDLKPASVPDEPVEFEMMTLDGSEKDNSKWLSYIMAALDGAKTFEIHCWNEEPEWIDLALRFGRLKDDDWRHGKIIAGDVTPEFVQMLLSQPKPADTGIYNKMTPFFNVFLDNKIRSCHYGTELCIGGALMYKCLCCGNETLPVPANEAIAYICPVCWWENDVFIHSDDEPSNENHEMTLLQAQDNYHKYGICDQRLLHLKDNNL